MKVFSRIEPLKELVINRKIGYVKIFADDKTMIATSQELNLTPEQNFEYLEETIAGLEGEYIMAKMYKNEKDNTPLTHYIKLSQDEKTNTAAQQNLPNNMVIGLLKEMSELRQDMLKAEHNHTIESLKKQIEEVKNAKKEKPENPIYEKLLNLGAEYLIKSKTPGANIVTPGAVVNQAAQATATAVTPNKVGIFGTGEKEKFSDLILRWKTNDPKFMTVMEKIIILAETNPETYQMYSTMLVNS